MFFIDHISPAPILDPQASNCPSEEHILERNAARFDHADTCAKTATHATTNWPACCFIIYKYPFCVLMFLYNKQPAEWKEKADRAQLSNQGPGVKSRHTDHNIISKNARDKFDPSMVAPEEIERPKKSYKLYWDTTPFVVSVRQLKIDLSNQKALAVVEKFNSDIKAHNDDQAYNPGRGTFPLKHVQDE